MNNNNCLVVYLDNLRLISANFPTNAKHEKEERRTHVNEPIRHDGRLHYYCLLERARRTVHTRGFVAAPFGSGEGRRRRRRILLLLWQWSTAVGGTETSRNSDGVGENRLTDGRAMNRRNVRVVVRGGGGDAAAAIRLRANTRVTRLRRRQHANKFLPPRRRTSIATGPTSFSAVAAVLRTPTLSCINL